MRKESGLLDGYDVEDREGKRLRIKDDAGLARFLRGFLTLTETPVTPYRRRVPGRPPVYGKKAHWVNGRKVSGQA